MKVLSRFILMIMVVLSGSSYAIEIRINKEVDVSIQRFIADGDKILLWLPSEAGLLPQEIALSSQLVSRGLEVWYVDLLEAYFYSNQASSIERIPTQDVVKLLEGITRLTDKKIIIVANGRGAILALRAVRLWQQKYPDNQSLAGSILFSPKMFIETPEPGAEGDLMPVVRVSNLPVFIIQPENSPWHWKVDRVVPALEKNGSDVYVRKLAAVRDRFYFRPDATVAEEKMALQMPELIDQAARLLRIYESKSRVASITSKLNGQQKTIVKKQRLLRAFRGNPEPESLLLNNLAGQAIDLKQLKGRVVLVNFWASWCPPCVHEMPSMQKLSEYFAGKPFEIMAVNMAEDKKTINNFLQTKVNVNFQIVMDSDGAALKRWKVFAFPTSYIIGKKGKIRLALFGSIDWMQPDVVEKISVLVNE